MKAMNPLRAFVAIGFAAICFACVAPPMFMTPPRIYSGVHLVATGKLVEPNRVSIDADSPAFRAGLRTGDVLRCLNVRDHALLIRDSLRLHYGYQPGTALSTCAERNDGMHIVTFVAGTRGIVPLAHGSVGLAIVRLAVVLVFLTAGIALVIVRPSPMTWAFYCYCLGSMPSSAPLEVWTILAPRQYELASGIPFTLAWTASPCLLLFSVLVPDFGVPNGWRRIAFIVTTALTGLWSAAVVFRFLFTSAVIDPRLLNAGDTAFSSLALIVIVTRLVLMEREGRARFAWAAAAIIFGIVANDARNILSQIPMLQQLSTAVAISTVFMPLALAYAILKVHVIDVRFVISRTLVYGALTTALVAAIGLIDWISSSFLKQVRAAVLVDAVLTIALAFALHRIYGWLEHAVDFIVYRRKHDAESSLSRLARTLQNAEREEMIDNAVVYAPYEKLDLTMAALFRAHGPVFPVSVAAGVNLLGSQLLDPADELLRVLAAERRTKNVRDLSVHIPAEFQAFGAAPGVAVPIVDGSDVIAIAVYGIHRDGTKLDPDEVETLEDLCEKAGHAYLRRELLNYRRRSQAQGRRSDRGDVAADFDTV
ncbi:MAG: GAF domain-containing protein [Candidatus Eremiobacteraeota bacterium]|nr:GAF domain-containing protein [Candidatus Eremiobacteraeota bacterium]